MPLAEVSIAQRLIDAVVALVQSGYQPTDPATFRAAQAAEPPGPNIVTLLGVQTLVMLLSWLLEPAKGLVHRELADLFTREITLRILRKATSLVNLEFFESPRFFDMLQRAQQEAGWRPPVLLDQLGWVLRISITLVAMLAVLVAFQPLLAVAVVVLALPPVIVQFRHQRENWGLTSWEVPEVRRMQYFRQLLVTREPAKEVRLFGLSDFFHSQYVQQFDAVLRRHRKLRFTQWRATTSLAVLAALGSAGAYAFVIAKALSGDITLGGISLYVNVVSQVQNGLASIVSRLASIYEANLFANHLFDLLNIQPTIAMPTAEYARLVPTPLRHGVEFRNVRFSYPGNEHPILQDVSFTIEPCQTVALVGANGAGKTTLVKLLSRLYDPSGGQILVDNIDISDYDIQDWRKNIAVVLQDFTKYHLTAHENIGIGAVENIADGEAVKVAASRSGADTVIERLPHGYETTLGRQFWSSSTPFRTIRLEEGVDISGGEWQKIALARAFIRTAGAKDAGSKRGVTSAGASPTAQLLILDEPTAALDAESEEQVYSRFKELTRGKATLLISHRLSTVRLADVTLVLKQGEIVERGSHEQLVAKGGEYARLYQLQAERYR